MHKRWIRLLTIAGLLVLGLRSPSAHAAFLFNDPAFATVWNRADKPVLDEVQPERGFVWGPLVIASGGITIEQYDGVPRSVQYFDKARMEINLKVADQTAFGHVTTGLLVKELVTGQRQDGDNLFTPLSPSSIPVAGDPNDHGQNTVAPTYASFTHVLSASVPLVTGNIINTRIDQKGQVSTFTPPEQRLLADADPVTQHHIADVFVTYVNQTGQIWNGNGYEAGSVFAGDPLYVFGRPITEPYWVRAVVAGDEQDVLVQLFERRVLTYTPHNADPNKVEMGNVGQHYFRWRYHPNEGCRPPAVLPTPTSGDFPNDFSQYLAAYQRSGPIPAGGPGNVLPYPTGARTLYGSPALSSDGQVIVFSANDQGVIALRVGATFDQVCELWRYKPAAPGVSFDATPLLYGGLAFVGDSTGALYAIDLQTGTPRWVSTALLRIRVGMPVSDGTNLYFTGRTKEIPQINYGFAGGYLYAVSIADGSLVWQSCLVEGVNNNVIFGFDDNLYFGAWENQVYAYTRSGQPVDGWPSQQIGYAASAPTASGPLTFAHDRIYGEAGDYLFALDRHGQIVDQVEIGGGIGGGFAPAVVNDRVYVAITHETAGQAPTTEIQGLSATNFGDVQFRWGLDEEVGGALAVVDGYLYVPSAGTRLYQVKIDDPSVSRRLFTSGDGFRYNAPLVADGRVYSEGGDGSLYIAK
ncbi:MAG: PQQ-binding-like beta-propeller repeat protein [Herpetosiphonaceae bacterium]|nr:PQQ-binding-like beta-propeller repeat protein [Herpetosiphonaceae bacterium]